MSPDAARPDPADVEEAVQPLVEHSREITRELFDLLGEDPSDLQGEIDRTVQALQVFFNKWVVEIMYILRMRGVLRFNELKEGLGGISGRTLSTRLKELEARGLVHRELYDEMPVRVEYSLTERGMDVANLSMPLILYLRGEGVHEIEDEG